MELRKDHDYYITDYKQINEYMIEFMKIVKDKKIVKFISSSGLSWNGRPEPRGKVYDTDAPNYLIFEDNTVLKFDYRWFSLINIKLTKIECLNNREKEMFNDSDFLLDMDCYNCTIVDYELNCFADEYIINPSNDQTRPEGGDYFKEIIFHLDNKKKICICPQNAETDGYCDIWMEDNDNRNEFNGEEHKVWWK